MTTTANNLRLQCPQAPPAPPRPMTTSEKPVTYNAPNGPQTHVYICEIFEWVSKAENEDARINLLRKYQSDGLLNILRGACDENILWLLPVRGPNSEPVDPPYTPNPEPLGLSRISIHSEYRRLWPMASPMYDFDNVGPNYTRNKREQDFLRLLESIPAADAKIVLAMTRKDLSPWNISHETVRAAFPNLLESKESYQARLAEHRAKHPKGVKHQLPVEAEAAEAERRYLSNFTPFSKLPQAL